MPPESQNLQLVWALPFLGILASIAFLPLFTKHFWHGHYGKISAFWALAFLIPYIFVFGAKPAFALAAHSLIEEFVPFIVILIALYTVAGGIYLEGNLRSGALANTALLGGGSLLAGLIGTTGASMMLIRPLIRANSARRHNAHVVVFFIFLVSNIGGALTPLGDPPLFIGYMKGVDFFWPAQYLLTPMLLCLALTLGIFFILDSYISYRDSSHEKMPDAQALRLHGGINLAFMALVIAVVIITPSLMLGNINVFGIELYVSALLRDGALLSIAALSLALTPRQAREGNVFHWGPIEEVIFLFATIFLTAAPVLMMLQEGRSGALGGLIETVNGPASYFWMTGLLSAFLDNAPTYLVFFQLAGGDAQNLMGPPSNILVAISCGAVFMGALSYIGNAPNFMVRAIAEDQGIKMPSFFGYMIWAGVALLPVFALLSFIFFRA